jgi:F0F1-type ATP synthase delta subunit
MAAVLGRYARAYADVAVKQKLNPEKTIAEFEQMAAAIHGSKELRNVLENPAVSREQKLNLLDPLFAWTQDAAQLLAVLIDHRRPRNISDGGAVRAQDGAWALPMQK